MAQDSTSFMADFSGPSLELRFKPRASTLSSSCSHRHPAWLCVSRVHNASDLRAEGSVSLAAHLLLQVRELSSYAVSHLFQYTHLHRQVEARLFACDTRQGIMSMVRQPTILR